MTTLYLLVLFVVAGVGAQWLAARLHIPGLILLVVAGVTLGPVTGVLDPEALFGDLLDPFIKLAAALVLFEGGLSLHVREAKHVGRTLWWLIASGLFLGFAVVALLGVVVGGLTPATAAVLAAILVVTGPTVVIPMLRGARIAFRPAALLKWEGIVNDPFGALLAILALQLTLAFDSAGSPSFVSLLLCFLGLALAAGVLGALVGWLIGRALDSGLIPENLKSGVILASVLGVFAVAELIGHENGLLAVTAMGLVLGNSNASSLEGVRHFKEQISSLLVAFLFVVLSARLELADLEALLGPPLVLIAMILFVARPVVALAATWRSPLPWNERALLAWIAPRGVVAAAVAGTFEAPLRNEAHSRDAGMLVPIVFGVIIATVVLQGLSIRPLARWLGLAARRGNGILVVGASSWAVALAEALTRAGAFVAIADTRYRRVMRARIEGVEVHHGDVLSEEVALDLPLERVSWLLAATADDSYNSLVCMHFARELERSCVLQLAPSPTVGSARGKEVGSHLTGALPWGDVGTYGILARRFWQNGVFKVTQLTEQFTFGQLLEQNPDAMFLFYVHQLKLGVLGEGAEAPAGSKVVYLVEDPAAAP